jgi:hypothetical protein
MSWFALTPIKNLPAPAFADADGARAWLQQAKRPAGEGTPVVPLDALCEQLERLQGATLDGFARATVLEALRHDALVALAGQRQRFAFAPRPLNAGAFAALTANQRAWTALATGYLQCTEEFAPGDPAITATAAHRALMAFKLALEDHFFAGVEPPAQLWSRPLRIVELALARGFARQTVVDPTLTDQGRSSVLQQYMLLALTGLADPYALVPAEYNALQRLLTRWRDLPEFAAQRDDDSKRRWVNLRLLETGHRQAAENPLWLDISLVRGKLRRRIDSLQAGESPDSLSLGKELSGSAALTVLDRVRRRLHEAYDPSSAGPRQATGDSIFLAATVEEAFSLLTGMRYNANPKANAATDRVLHDRMALFGHDSIIQDGASEKPKFGEEWVLGSSGAQADLGVALSNSADAVRTSVQLGQLIVLRSGDRTCVAKVTRALTRQNGAMDLAALPYPGTPQAVEAHVYDQSGQMHFPLLLVPGSSETKTTTCAFVANGIGSKVRQPVETNLSTPRKLRLTSVIERGPNFECHKFDPI